MWNFREILYYILYFGGMVLCLLAFIWLGPSPVFKVGGIIVSGGGLYAVVWGSILLWRERRLAGTKISNIKSLGAGSISIHGRVIPVQGRILISPFSNNRCVYYKYTIEEGMPGRGQPTWIPLCNDEHGTRFFLQDKTGVVFVDPRGAKVDISADFEWESDLFNDLPGQIEQFLESHVTNPRGLLGNKILKVTEYFIPPGDELYITGKAAENPYIQEVLPAQDATYYLDTGLGTPHLMIKKHDEERKFHIFETEGLKRLRWKAIVAILGGSLVIMLGIYMFLLSASVR